VATNVDEEGWFLDPFGAHEQRWFSAGSPTKLVRDRGVESYDPPPGRAVARPLVPVAERQAPAAATFRRADDAERHSDSDGALKRADDGERGVTGPDYGDEAIDPAAWTSD
jgi:hypothetical protein